MMREPSRSHFSVRNFFVLLLILALPVLAVLGWMYWSAQAVLQPVDYAKLLTGYIKRAQRYDKLAPNFTDTDGDMVADAPKDPAQQLDPDVLVFAPIAASKVDTAEVWGDFTTHLGKVTGKKVKFASYDSSEEQLEALAGGKLHVTGVNTGFVPPAVNGAGFVPMATLARADGVGTYEMVIIVPADSPVKELADLKDKTVLLTAPGSHSGFKAPLIVLRDDFHMRPGQEFSFVMSGGHTSSFRAIGEKKAAAAAVANDLLDEAIANPASGLKPGSYREIYRSKPFPKAAYGASAQLKPELAAKVKQAYLTFDFKGTKLEEKLRGSKTEKFVGLDYKKDFAIVRDIDAAFMKW